MRNVSRARRTKGLRIRLFTDCSRRGWALLRRSWRSLTGLPAREPVRASYRLCQQRGHGKIPEWAVGDWRHRRVTDPPSPQIHPPMHTVIPLCIPARAVRIRPRRCPENTEPKDGHSSVQSCAYWCASTKEPDSCLEICFRGEPFGAILRALCRIWRGNPFRGS